MSLLSISLWLSTLLLAPYSDTKPNTPAPVDIPWKAEKRLSWQDFVAAPAPDNNHHALTSTNLEMKVKCENNKLKFKVEAIFNPNESWTRNPHSAALLAHEQLHFDITEIHARMLRKRLMEANNACSSGANALNKYANEAFDNWHKEEDLYDRESRHGLDKENQAAWEAKVSQRLKELEAYK